MKEYHMYWHKSGHFVFLYFRGFPLAKKNNFFLDKKWFHRSRYKLKFKFSFEVLQPKQKQN